MSSSEDEKLDRVDGDDEKYVSSGNIVCFHQVELSLFVLVFSWMIQDFANILQ